LQGWASTSLSTSSLLKAVGVGSSAVGATAAAAAIKFITKDGIGALGRLLVRILSPGALPCCAGIAEMMMKWWYWYWSSNKASKCPILRAK
jgi:Vitamin B6 photo-protection and homoeostasis